MKLLRTIVVPWTPYGFEFTADGSRLVGVGGAWYGQVQILSL